jgi:hypothetical protein
MDLRQHAKQNEHKSQSPWSARHEQAPERPAKEGGKKWDEPRVPELLPTQDSRRENSVEPRGDQPDGRSEHRGPQAVREVNGAWVEHVYEGDADRRVGTHP